MINNQVVWQEIVAKLDDAEVQVASSMGSEFDFCSFNEYFEHNFFYNKSFEKWQVIEVQQRIQRIIQKIKKSISDLESQKVDLLTNKENLIKYNKAAILND